MKTGVIQPHPGLGQMVMFLPALRAIAENSPDKKITLFAKDSAQAHTLLANEHWVDRIVPVAFGRGLWSIPGNILSFRAALRENNVDRLFVLHKSRRYSLTARLAGVKRVESMGKTLRRKAPNSWQASLDFLCKHGVPVANRYARLSLSPHLIEKIRARFADYPQPWFIVAPGGNDARRWPADRFALCIDDLAARLGGTLFITGESSEAGAVEQVRSLCHPAPQIVPLTDLPLEEFLALAANSLGLLGNNGGATLTTAALGRPAIALYDAAPAPCPSPNLLQLFPDLPPGLAKGMARISANAVRDFLRNAFPTI